MKDSLAIAYAVKRRNQVKKMADGGQVKDDVPEPNKKSAEEMQKGATESGFQPKQWMKNLKEGLAMYKGGEVEFSDSDDEPIEDASMMDEPSDFLSADEEAEPSESDDEKKSKRQQMLSSVIRRSMNK